MKKFLYSVFIIVSIVSCNTKHTNENLFKDKIKKDLEDNAFLLNATFNIIELDVLKIEAAPIDSVYKNVTYERAVTYFDSIKKNNGNYSTINEDKKYKELQSRKLVDDTTIKGYYVYYSVKGKLVDANNLQSNILHNKLIAYFDNYESLLYNQLHFRFKKERETSYTPNLNLPNSNALQEYYTIGSTEREVLNIQGEPNSITDFGGGNKLYFYGASSISFKDGILKSYSNDGGLKIRVGISENNIKPVESITKYVYFIFEVAQVGTEIDPITNKMKVKEFEKGVSEVYQIKDYDSRKMTLLQLCIEKDYEEALGLSVISSEKVYDTKDDALRDLRNENGILFTQTKCEDF